MFDVFRLSCLDFQIWLRSGQKAAAYLNCNQATISRNAKLVTDFLDLDARKFDGEWSLGGDIDLLSAEREVHQLYRWKNAKSLRIDSIYGVGSAYLKDFNLSEWICGPCNFLCVDHPKSLLKNSILDTWLACYPDVPEEDDELLVIHLTRYPSHFLVDQNHPLLNFDDELGLDDLLDFPVLSLPDGAFPKIQRHLHKLNLHRLKVESKRHDLNRWEGRTENQLTISYGTVHTIGDFDGSKVFLPLSTGLTLGDSLVVKRCFANTYAFELLLSFLIERAQFLSQNFDDVNFCMDSSSMLSR